MKRIVFTVTNDLTYDRRMQRICSTLAANGFDVLLIGRQLPASLPLTGQPFQQERLKCVFNKGKLFYLEYNLRLFFRLLRSKADIFSAVDLDTIVPCFVVADLKGKRKVYDAHEYFSEVPEVVNRPLTKKVWEMVASFFIPKADAAYTVGECLAEIFQKRYGVHFETIRNVPDLASPSPFDYVYPDNIVRAQGDPHRGHGEPVEPSASQPKYLLYQGALNVGRGLEELIEAMREIDLPLKIAGEGDLSTQLRQQVKAAGLDHKIEFLGFVKPENLHEVTVHSYLGLNLLHPIGLSYYYSLANKFFDYIHAGVPTLNMDFPEYHRINEQYEVSLLLNELTPKAIVQAVNRLKNEPGLYNRLSENCLSAKTAFNWQKEQQKLLILYREL